MDVEDKGVSAAILRVKKILEKEKVKEQKTWQKAFSSK